MNLFKLNASRIRLFFLYAFVFSLSFENLRIFNLGTITTSKIIGFLYFASWLLKPKKLLSFPKSITIPFIIISLLFFWLSFTSLVHHLLGISDITYDFTLLQSIILFILVSKEIDINYSVQKKIFIFIVLGVSLASILVLNGIGVQSIKGEVVDSVTEVTRVYFFGMNPNDFGALASIALLLSVWLVKKYSKEDRRMYLFILTTPLIFTAVGYSGSRAAIITTVFGILILFLINRGNLLTKLKYYLFAAIFLIAIFISLQDFTVLAERTDSFIKEGNTGDRWRRWVTFIDYIGDYPLFGVDSSPLDGFHRVPDYFNPHNAFLMYGYLGGLVGIVLSLAFYCNLLFSAIKKFILLGDSLYIIIVIFCFFIVFKSGKGMDFKFIWIVLACVASQPLLNFKFNFEEQIK